VTLALGPAKLFLFPARPGDDRAVGRDLGLFGNPPGIDHISFGVDDVDALHASLTADGIDAGPQPADQDWGAPALRRARYWTRSSRSSRSSIGTG
jgi:methylmalonyl-CoA/ethylmalonyl-CoA epimerase